MQSSCGNSVVFPWNRNVYKPPFGRSTELRDPSEERLPFRVKIGVEIGTSYIQGNWVTIVLTSLCRSTSSMAKAGASSQPGILTGVNLWLNITATSLKLWMRRNGKRLTPRIHRLAVICTISNTWVRLSGKSPSPSVFPSYPAPPKNQCSLLKWRK